MNSEEINPKDIQIHQFEKCEPLVLGEEWASGSFGSVHVVDTPTGRVAVKCVPELEGHVNRELDTCIQLARKNHPNIVKLFGYWISNRVLYLVMEFMPQTLGSVLNRLSGEKMRMKMDRMKRLMFQLASVLDYLEQIQLMHRDLKPDNILLNANANELKLADFGSAKFVEKDKPNITYVCTRFYRAPCLILNRNMYSSSIDIWSFGCILGEFAYGNALFTGDTQVDVMARMIRIRGMLTVDDIAGMPTSFPETIEMAGVGIRCTPKPWSKVFTLKLKDKVVNTSYGEKYEQVLDACLKWNPLNRISAHDLCKHQYWGGVSCRKNLYNFYILII